MMMGLKKLYLLLPLNLLFLASASQEIPSYYCGSIKIQQPLIHQNYSFLSQIILCKSEKLYFRTSIGLFEIQSINYDDKLIIVPHASSSSRRHLSAGFAPVYGKFELGTRISFVIPDHVPHPCNECEKPYGNCGVGLRCACHPNKCKDKVISWGGAALRPCGDILVYLVLFIVFLQGF